MKTKDDLDRVIIFDTTLRDGEQSPGCSLNQREKLEIAHALAALNVDVIEAGFPIASPDDFAAVHAIAESVEGPIIAALCRIVEKDIERAGQAIAPARKRRLHTFSSGSDIHLEKIMKMTRAQNIERSVKAEGQVVLGWRDVPVNREMPMSPTVRDKEPVIRQVFVGRGIDVFVTDALERKLEVLDRIDDYRRAADLACAAK